MKIGLTYDLKDDYIKEGYGVEETAEMDKPETIEGIEKSLHELGYETERIGHAKNLMKLLVQGKKWDLVFNIAEGLYGYGREAVIPAMLDVYQIPYTFSDPRVLCVCLDKAMTKRIVRDYGVPTTDFFVAYNAEDLADCRLPFPLFVKPVAEGTGKGISAKSIIEDKKMLLKACERIWTEFKQPTLVEPYLPGREFTVGMRGEGKDTAVIAITEVKFTPHADKNIYSYSNKAHYEDRVKYELFNDQSQLQREIEKVCLDAWKALECRDTGRIDLRLDGSNKPMFMEVNPLAGLHPIDSDLPILCYQSGKTYTDLIRWIVDSAKKRIQ